MNFNKRLMFPFFYLCFGVIFTVIIVAPKSEKTPSETKIFMSDYETKNFMDRIVYRTVEVEGCQYIIAKPLYNSTFTMVHKGNCTNTIHSLEK